MMQYASQGLRNTARKGSNLVHGPGGHTANSQRSMHFFSPFRSSGQAALHTPSSGSAPRNSINKLLSFSRNIFQQFYTHLTTPGLKAIHLPDSHPLHTSFLRGSTIQSRLSTAARYSLKNNALKRQASTFLPRGPGPVPPRLGGVAEVGLGVARNFSTGRPIFQHLAENVPVAVRALYESDLDLELMKRNDRKRLVAPYASVTKTNEKIKPLQKFPKHKTIAEQTKQADLLGEVEHYFSSAAVAPVTTYLLIPLAPTAVSSRPGSSQDPRLLPSLSYIGSLHESHATHTLRVSSLFTRLDQANVWARGVQCSAYSQGSAHRKRPEASEDDDPSEEGVCTFLKVEFVGWSKAEVRSIIGESGTGWCVLEEVLNEEDEGLTDIGTLSPGLSEEELSNESLALSSGVEMSDPSESFIIPTLDFSSSFNSTPSSSHDSPSNDLFTTVPSGMANDPWVDDYSDSSSWVSTPYSEFSELIIDTPSNGLFWSGHGLGPGLGFSSQFETMSDEDEAEPREVML